MHLYDGNSTTLLERRDSVAASVALWEEHIYVAHLPVTETGNATYKKFDLCDKLARSKGLALLE